MTMVVAAPAPPTQHLTADEFARLYAGSYAELVDGVAKEKAVPHAPHGKVGYRMVMAVGRVVEAGDLGHVFTLDTFVKVGPDKVRGPDLCFLTYDRMPKARVPDGAIDVPPDLVVEVRSPSGSWGEGFGKVGEYLDIGVRAVVVIDMASRTASVYRPDRLQEIVAADDDLTVPDVLPGFAVRVGKLFE